MFQYSIFSNINQVFNGIINVIMGIDNSVYVYNNHVSTPLVKYMKNKSITYKINHIQI